MSRTRKLLAALAVAAVAAVGVSAFTAANSFDQSSTVAGYGAISVTGVNAESVSYVTDGTGLLTDVKLRLTGDTTTNDLALSFDQGSGPGTTIACDDAGDLLAVPGSTVYDCDVSSKNVQTHDLVEFELSASNKVQP
jgi:hypothetical protein